MLASVYDAVRGVQYAVIANGGGKPDRPTPYPRPKTAIEIVRKIDLFTATKSFSQHKRWICPAQPGNRTSRFANMHVSPWPACRPPTMPEEA